jgi:hypothetical protein
VTTGRVTSWLGAKLRFPENKRPRIDVDGGSWGQMQTREQVG